LIEGGLSPEVARRAWSRGCDVYCEPDKEGIRVGRLHLPLMPERTFIFGGKPISGKGKYRCFEVSAEELFFLE